MKLRFTFKRVVAWSAVVVGSLAVIGLFVAWLGFVPVAASAGHWNISSWFLHFTMRQAVKTQSLLIKLPPNLADPAMVMRGAGHFDFGCAPCHGAPGVAASPIAVEMTPHPPELAPRIDEWAPEELFWIVKHGVKFTGMPAWIAQQRDDEVWSMVAFLLRLPELSPRQYGSLAYGKEPRGRRLEMLQQPFESILSGCARCHGRNGAGRGLGAFPRLADQSEAYLLAALQAYAKGHRYSGIMQPQAQTLAPSTLRRLARHYASQQNVPVAGNPNLNPADIEHGEQIAKKGLPQQGVPACVHCHGPSDTPRNPYYPVLAGQYVEYLEMQLELFQKGRRGGSPFSPIMHEAAHRLEPEQIKEVAAYYADLKPAY